MIRHSLIENQQALPDQVSPYDSKAMPLVTGPAFGTAIRVALGHKGMTQKELARHFGVTPQSVQDWLKRGVVGKDKLFALLDLFRDVVGPEHWGLEAYPPEIAALRLMGGADPETARQQPELREALQVLHDHARRAPPSVRAELQRVTDLYWTNPDRYASLIDSLGDLLLGEITSSTRTSVAGYQ
jgi:transcriptional regulator with XRE-family HTH domain